MLELMAGYPTSLAATESVHDGTSWQGDVDLLDMKTAIASACDVVHPSPIDPWPTMQLHCLQLNKRLLLRAGSGECPD